jgi:hypothetical protein
LSLPAYLTLADIEALSRELWPVSSETASGLSSGVSRIVAALDGKTGGVTRPELTRIAARLDELHRATRYASRADFSVTRPPAITVSKEAR